MENDNNNSYNNDSASQPLTQNITPQGTRTSSSDNQQSPKQKIRVVFPDVGFLTQFAACFLRFSIQQIRDPFSVALQILLPVLIVGAMAGVSTLSPSEIQPSKEFVSAPPAGQSNVTVQSFAGTLKDYVCYDDGTFYPPGYSGPRLTVNATGPSVLANDPFIRELIHPCSDYYNLPGNTLYRAAPTTFPWVCSQEKERDFIHPEGLCGFMNPTFPITNAYGRTESNIATIPTINELLVTQWASRLIQPFVMPDFLVGPSIRNSLLISGVAYLAAASAEQKAAANRLLGILNQTSTLFKNFAYNGMYNSMDELAPRITNSDNEGATWAIITVNKFGDDSVPEAERGLDIELNMNRSAAGWTVRPRVRLYSGGERNENYLLYLSGTLTLEKAISEAYGAMLRGNSNNINATSANQQLDPTGTPIAIAPMPYASYRIARFLEAAGALMPLLLTLTLLYSVSQLVKNIVEEKEKKIRAGMQAMGLGRSVAATSSLAVFIVQGLITAIINTIILNTTFLNLTDGTIIFVTLLLFSISSSCFGVLMSVFFDKARVSGIIAPIVFLMCAIPSVAIPQGSAAGINRVLSFLSPSAFSLAMRNLVQYEQVQGMGWNDMANPLDEVQMGFVLFMLLLDCFLYYFLALYLDNILKSDWGIHKPCCFCFTSCCHKKNTSEIKDRSTAYGGVDANGNQILQTLTTSYPGEGVTEPFYATDTAAVSFYNVFKRFPQEGGTEKIAVNDFSMHFLEGQINVVLGANGCGKTTSVNMMTGMLEISDGDITVCDVSVLDKPELTQQLIGICPQHNLLWDKLSCMQHLIFYAKIKGLPADLAEKRALQLLKIVDLSEKKDQTSSELSGGQKRRLSVAIAFVAGSPFIVLDECTAGVDPPSRRAIWKLLQRMCKSRSLGTDFDTGEKLFDEPDYMKSGCSILLVTHYLDEADILGNRIAIMSAGQLHSFGTPEFLKAKLGRGYLLRFTTKATLPPAQAHQLVNDLISQVEMPGLTLAEAKGQEIMVRVPNGQIPKIPNALRACNNPNSSIGQRYRIEAVSIEVSTMEDVFLRIAEEEQTRRAAAEQKVRESQVGYIKNTDDGTKAVSMLESDQALPQSIRDAVDVCFLAREQNEAKNADQVAPGGSFFMQFVALCLKRLNFMKRDRRTLIFQLLVPIICVLLGMALTGVAPPESGLLDLTTMYDPEKEQIPFTAATCNNNRGIPINSTNINSWAVYSPVDTGAEFSSYLLDNARKHGDIERLAGWACADPEHLSSTVAYNIDDCSPINTPASTLNSSTCLQRSTLLFYNFSSQFSSAFGMYNWVNSQIFRITDAAARPTMPVKFGLKPMPFSSREQSNLDAISLLLGALFVALPFGFIPSTFVSFIVREREVRAKMMQRLSGVNFGAFWLSHTVFDFCTFLFTELLTLIIFVALDHPEYVGPNAIGFVLVLFVVNAAATTGAGYCLSFLFESHASAQTFTMLIGFMTGFVLVIFGFVLDSLDAGWVRFIFRLFPPYCFGEALSGLAIAESQEKSFGIKLDRWAIGDQFYQVGFSLLFLGCEAILAYIVVFAVEFKSIWLPFLKGHGGASHNKDFTPNPVPPSEDEGWDVKEERQRTAENSLQPNGNPFPLQVKELRKVYNRSLINTESAADKKSDKSDFGAGRVVAVKNLSFSVEQGTIFGLCGTNGAGKTSTMEIIVGANEATAGDCYVNGHSVTHEGNITRQYIGYCPQFDALFDLLTCIEHLKLYCAIRGVEPDKQDLVCNGLLEAVGLKDYRDVISMSLSGGNKRKLSVALSLVGGPKLLLLDEMSAGIDTAARRVLWDVISYISSKCAIVLTTHHLEEIEALAHSVGIMVPGKFACHGPLGRIKASVGGGVEIRIRTNNAEEIVEVERMLYATAKKESGISVETTQELLELVEKVEGRITLRLPAENAAKVGVTSADVFEWLLAMQRIKHFEFTVSNATIEQVFLAIADQQNDGVNEAKNQKHMEIPSNSSNTSNAAPVAIHSPRQQEYTPASSNTNNNNIDQPVTQRGQSKDFDDFL